MRFSFQHDLEAPLARVEAALGDESLARETVRLVPKLESAFTLEHSHDAEGIHRVIRFQASAPLDMWRDRPLAREALQWEEHFDYLLREHRGSFRVLIAERWRKYVHSEGVYTLEPLGEGRTRRRIEGEIDVRLGPLGFVIERKALSDIKSIYEAEARALAALARTGGAPAALSSGA